MTFTYTEFIQGLGLYFWPFVRIGAMLSIIPLFGMRGVPARVRILLSLLIAIVIAPMIPLPPPVDPFSWTGLGFMVQQILIGLAMGVILMVVFQAFVIAGQLIAMAMGLAFAMMVDPATGVQTPVVSQYFTILVTLLFLALDGHMMVIYILAGSFELLPVGANLLTVESLRLVYEFGRFMFSGGVLVALPAVTALLLINISFGVITRAAPALNIFAVGFPVTLLAGLVMLLFITPMVLPHLQELLNRAIDTIELLRLNPL
ncbi:flagellar biosynthesis protein FliR [Thiomicrospira aerophila AL3]|uniref:Flagellar biosynthetic protein FliR n=1 Tax=Thiomicrospira aerophila AL3 TaxID=717772 RepID=W0DWB0_9GAMM|nr:flagellar biosynthetic protein FliR [Thiomicrospira aerophila]AHF01568.1 flagellar biosynthesis protein FliR [Thiomicrospira aerophila AL3]